MINFADALKCIMSIMMMMMKAIPPSLYDLALSYNYDGKYSSAAMEKKIQSQTLMKKKEI
jgi:hypothetical protein